MTAAVRAALDQGITWYDTAAMYGLGHSEEVLGRALGHRRADVVVATKFGVLFDDAGNARFDSTYDAVMRECDASLRRLGADYIDLYQQHIPDAVGTPLEETMRALDDLVRAGKVRYTGCSNVDVSLIERMLRVRRLDAVQPMYSLLFSEAERDLLPFCQEHGVGVVAYSPLASGLLAGHYTPDHQFGPEDFRATYPEFVGERLRQHLTTVERLRPIAARHERTLAQLAVAWVLANPAVTSAIVGIRRPDHITGIVPAAAWRLDEDTLAAIANALQPEAATSVADNEVIAPV